ncbi:MAG TPA: 2TM domain-containing protein [Mycobacteriales bacterium]|nr:2TM domain-containing protein [Mycobacteriales bacterium]
MSNDLAFNEMQLREQAVARLKKQRDFKAHLLVFFLVNAFIVLIWAMTDSGGFFWPAFPIGFWGIGVVMNGWDAYRHEEFSEVAIHREMERLTHR